MLQQQDNGIYELNNASHAMMAQTITNGATGGGTGTILTGGAVTLGYCQPVNHGYYQPSPVYWKNYAVYVCTDKTKKAIDVLKALQADKLLTCNSVARFIELVEKISAIL